MRGNKRKRERRRKEWKEGGRIKEGGERREKEHGQLACNIKSVTIRTQSCTVCFQIFSCKLQHIQPLDIVAYFECTATSLTLQPYSGKRKVVVSWSTPYLKPSQQKT